jgi:hypothetical protein
VCVRVYVVVYLQVKQELYVRMLYDGAVVQMDKQCRGKDLCSVDHFMDLTGLYMYIHKQCMHKQCMHKQCMHTHSTCLTLQIEYLQYTASSYDFSMQRETAIAYNIQHAAMPHLEYTYTQCALRVCMHAHVRKLKDVNMQYAASVYSTCHDAACTCNYHTLIY